MSFDRLDLLKPQFMDAGKGSYFCPRCAQMVGGLEFYPAIKQQLAVHWPAFP